MDQKRSLAPVMIGTGTLSSAPDMLRALETLENLEYCYEAHGDLIEEGTAVLVKLMADSDSATMIVNGCLFLNIASYRYLDFCQIENGRWKLVLHGDVSSLTLISIPEMNSESGEQRCRLLLEPEECGFESPILLDDDDEED